jgi:general secretion pathway protein G
MRNHILRMKMKRSALFYNVKEFQLDEIFSPNGARSIRRDVMTCVSYSKRGVTLIELMLVVCIIGIVSGIAVPAYTGYREKIDAAKGVAEMTGIGLLIDKFYAENNRYPNSLGDIGKGGLKDPWGRNYQYQNNLLIMANDKKNKCNGCRKDGPIHPLNTDYDLFSVGKDGKSDDTIRSQPSQDDIVRAFNGSYLGIVKDII